MMAFVLHLSHDRKDLAGGLSFSPDDLGKTLPERSVMIDPGKAQVLEREGLQMGHGVVDRRLAGFHLFRRCSSLRIFIFYSPQRFDSVPQ